MRTNIVIEPEPNHLIPEEWIDPDIVRRVRPKDRSGFELALSLQILRELRAIRTGLLIPTTVEAAKE